MYSYQQTQSPFERKNISSNDVQWALSVIHAWATFSYTLIMSWGEISKGLNMNGLICQFVRFDVSTLCHLKEWDHEHERIHGWILRSFNLPDCAPHFCSPACSPNVTLSIVVHVLSPWIAAVIGDSYGITCAPPLLSFLLGAAVGQQGAGENWDRSPTPTLLFSSAF